MNKLARNERGFSVVELLLVLVVVMILGGAGWIVYKRQSPTTQPTAHTTQISPKTGWLMYKSTHSSVEFQYPASWKLEKRPIQSVDKYTLESLSMTGTNGFTISYNLNKTNHDPIIYNAACISPPTVTVVSHLSNKLAISYSSHNDVAYDLWLGSVGSTIKGYGYATGQCRVRGIDYVSLPNDEYVSLDGAYLSSSSGQNNGVKTADFLNKPEIKDAIDVFKSLSF